MGGGIAGDTADQFFGQDGSKPHGGWLFRFFLHIIGNGMGANDHQVTSGNNSNQKLLATVGYILPRFTIVNNGSNTVKIGYGGNPTFPLVAGASYTGSWKNPVKAGLCFSDGGNAATVDVIS